MSLACLFHRDITRRCYCQDSKTKKAMNRIHRNQEIIDLAYNYGVLCREAKMLYDLKRGLPSLTNEEFNNGIYVVIEVRGCNDNGQVVVNIQFVGKQCHLKTVAELLSFKLNESDFEATPAPLHSVHPLVKFNIAPRPANCYTWTNKNGPIHTQLRASNFYTSQTTPDRSMMGSYDASYSYHMFLFNRRSLVDCPDMTDQRFREILWRSQLVRDICLASQAIMELQKFSSEIRPRPAETTTKQPTSTTKISSLRDIVRAEHHTTPVESNETADGNVSQENGEQGMKQNKKKTKNQGKSKTFKRKSQRPGRI